MRGTYRQRTASTASEHESAPGAPPCTKSSAFKRSRNKKRKKPRPQNPKEARGSAERSLTQESHLDEKVRSAETIEREQREQLATFESMLRKTKVNLRYAMMRRSRPRYLSKGHYVFIADGVYDFGS